ncbi:putative aminopeptidase-2 [Ornithodoros turicata]|uniref:putative aminopeptidase-2 n=1 Tax=Ornithodoros turicata TaxID=34597 RepID=UPI003139744B
MHLTQDGAEPSSSDGDRIHGASAAAAKATASTESDGRKRAAPDAAMSKTFVRRSTAACGLVVLLLLFCSVGLLLAFLKGHKQQTLSIGHKKSNRKEGFLPASPSYLPPTIPPSTTTTLTPPTTTREPAKPKYNFRLPDYILPLSYDLTLEPHLDRDTFDGEVWITVNATRATDKFFVHVFRLSVEEAEVFDDVGPLETGKLEIDDLNEFLVVPVSAVEGGPVPVGIYRLRFRFRGSLVGGIVGFYKSRYRIGNETRFLATSKFQPTYARRAFPCFDEPSFKSTFNVTLVHDQGYRALSNMRVLPGYPIMRDDRKLVTKFEESVPMVTYLVCFIVSDFKKTETIASMNKIPFSVYATPNQLNKTYYALDIGSRILNFYEEYFDLKYPLPKQDMIAIPDFVSGAMEHWGLITFREVNLLFDAKQSSPRNKQRVAAVVAHELAHMWFGNLVTMKWWDDLWLNEGFASYIEYKGIDHVEPKWDMMDQFLTEDLQPVMDLDSTTTSHPVVQCVSNPDEITEIFDTISYNKGASVLRMLENFLGHAVFRKGVSSFLTHHQFGNARTQDLWDELSAAAKWVLPRGYNVSTIMNTWTQQMGYPVVTMTRSMDDPTLITVTQDRFLRNTEHCDQDVASSYLWSIPLSYKTSAARNKVKHAWLHEKKDEFHIYDAGRDGWVKFNVNQTGYYLVNYDMRDWLRLGEVLQKHHEELTPADRSNLLYDAFQLAWSGRLSYDVLFNMTQYLIHEMHLIPWSTAHGSLLALSHLLENTEVRRPMQTYIRKLVDPIYKTLGWEDGEKHNDNLLRTVILDLACRNLHQECLKEAKRRLTAWVDHCQEVPRNIRSIVYRYGMYQSNGDHEWQFMWEKYLKEVSAQERVNLLYGMAHVRSPPLIHRYLTYAMNESYIRRQDFFSVLSFLAGNTVGRDIVWKFVRSKWDKLVQRFSLNDRNLGKAVKTICDYFTKQFDYNEMKAFFTKHPNAGAGKRARKQALENVRNNIAWIMQHEPSVAKWLTSNVIPEPWEGLRLPRHVTPHTYDVTLEPIPENDTVIGSASISVKLRKATNVILVHARNINIYETRIERASGPNIGKEIRFENEPFLYAENDFWVTQTKDIMPPGRYMLRFRFESSLLNSLQGLYKSSYTDSRTGEKRYIVTSHLQATAARMVFPCFDEPSFKANFTITVIHNRNMTALSNMPVERTANYSETKVATTFQESHKMVTYLVAVVVCDFEHVAGTTSRGTPVRVYARKDMIGYAGYALDTAIQVLEFFEQQFDIPYPLPKLDNIAVPDFQLGAMENWGLITFRESRLLYDPNTSSVSDKFKTAEGVAHELAHMWFGNLVTMKWWNDVWLNEGFATYISSKGVDAVHPGWDVENQFIYKLLTGVLEKDAVPSSHPIVLPVRNPNEISEIFDEISYYKGSAVIGMLESFMGSEDFARGVRNYLRTRKYGSAVTLDLWRELEHASSKSLHITTIMNTWTRQMGFPYVSVKRLETNTSLYEVSQQRFLLNPEAAANLTNDSAFRYMWEIPLTFKTSTKVQGLHWLKTNASEIFDVGLRKNSDWVKFNADFKGYYLVHYEEDDLGVLSDVLFENHKQLSPADRAELIFETFLLARAGVTPYPAAMELTGYLRKERHFIPLLAASTSLQHIARCLREDSEQQLFLVYLQYISEGAFEDFLWLDKGDHLTKRAREVAIELSCFSGDRICRQRAADALMAWVKGEQIAANLRELAYVWGMVHVCNEEIWEHMWQAYLKEPSAGERNKLLKGLASIRNVAIIDRLLNASLNESLIRRQDFYALMSHIAENTDGLHSVWAFLRKHWDVLVERFTLEDRKFGRIVYSVCKHFTTLQKLREMEEFFEAHPEAGAGTRARSQALAAVRDNIRWLANFREPVLNWIREYKVQPWENLRLPSHVVPVHYDLRLQPFLEDQYFEGKVDIEIQLFKPVRSIHVHIKDMNVTSASITEANRVIPVQESFEYEDNEFFVMKFDSTIDIGKYVLHYEFSGNMTKDLKGLYLSTYTDVHNQTRYLATTQFEPTDARSAFPCFDEPRFKATFSISLIHEPKYIAISNMPIKENSTTATGFRVTKFERTVAMTTYLVAVVVCDFAHIKGTSTNGVQVRVFAREDEIAKAEYAMASALKILSYFEEYFKIKYPLPKLDMIAIPDFSSGAMENWGLITYRETRLLYDPKTSSSTDKQGVCRVIAHEIAHMWFGNLVTMRWWDDLWLNEGFASYIQYKGMDHAEPDWESMTQYVSTALLMVFESDSAVTSHSIVQPVENPNEISSLFDTISYNKGAAVLRMLESFLSPEEFREGIAKYLRKYQYKNTLTVDLWEELESVSSAKVTISSTMDTWTRQMGYPVLSIERDCSNFTIEQSWFLMDRDTAVNRTASRFKYIWHIPLSYRTSAGHTGFIWLKKRKHTLNIDVPDDGWIKFNNNMTGVYFINYDDESFKVILNALKQEIDAFTPSDRAELIIEAFFLARAGYVKYKTAIELGLYIVNERHLVPWAAFEDVISFMYNRLRGTATGELLKGYVLALLKDVFGDLSFGDTGTHMERRLRTTLFHLACRFGHDHCLTSATNALLQWLGGKPVEPNFKNIVYGYGMRQIGNETIWQRLFDSYMAEPIQAERIKMMTALGQVQDEALIQRYLNFSFDESKVRGQDITMVFSTVANNPMGLEIAWTFLRKNWKDIVDKFTANSRIPGKLIKIVCRNFNSAQKKQEMEEFFAQNPDAGTSKHPREESLQSVQNNIKWISKYESDLATSLQAVLRRNN